MLTELDREKAPKYWPSEGQFARYGRLRVYHKRNFRLGDIEIRSFLIKEEHPTTPESKTNLREIIHLQYGNWPDFGVPTSTKPIRDLLILVSKFMERAFDIYSLNGPIVVHCSAGVGRTGVFIACHICLDKMRFNLPIYIQETVRRIRTQRQGMVRTEEQYSHIFMVMMDAFKTNLLKELRTLKKSKEMIVAEVSRSDDKNVAMC